MNTLTIEELLDAYICVGLCVPLSFLGIILVNTLRGNEELLEALFSIRSASYQREVGD
jgi:hypothetical protein